MRGIAGGVALCVWMRALAKRAIHRRGGLDTIPPRSRPSCRSHAQTPLDSPVQFSRPTSVEQKVQIDGRAQERLKAPRGAPRRPPSAGTTRPRMSPRRPRRCRPVARSVTLDPMLEVGGGFDLFGVQANATAAAVPIGGQALLAGNQQAQPAGVRRYRAPLDPFPIQPRVTSPRPARATARARRSTEPVAGCRRSRRASHRGRRCPARHPASRCAGRRH